jgi:hypothetical protein
MCLHPPEFFVGIDQRFELLSGAGLFESEQHAIKTIIDPEFGKAFLVLGGNNGLIGAGLIRRARGLLCARLSARSGTLGARRLECSLRRFRRSRSFGSPPLV